jgi:hypothetical protein
MPLTIIKLTPIKDLKVLKVPKTFLILIVQLGVFKDKVKNNIIITLIINKS